MRTVLVALTIGLFLFLTIPIYFILELTTKENQNVKDKISFALVTTALRFILWISGAKVTVKGKENIPKDEPVLFVSNHRSHFDILLAYTNVGKLTGFVAKKELGKIPMLRQWMINMNCIFLDRQNPKEALKAILQGIDNVKRGVSMFICPEGTRHQDGKMGEFKEGSLKIAQKAGCKVVPVFLMNTENLFENSDHRVTKANVLIQFGEPIDLTELSLEDKKRSAHYVQDKIIEMMNENSDFE